MAAAIGLRADFGAEDPRRLATAAGGDLRGRVTNGRGRGSAVQPCRIVRDWGLRFNAEGPAGLVDHRWNLARGPGGARERL
jgi:hypothetical protein